MSEERAAAGGRPDDRGGPCVVSVVDDDVAVRTALADMLDAAGYGACTFDGGEAFLRSDAAATTRLLITDVQLDGMDGLTLMSRVAAFTRRLPVIVITARSDEEIRRRAKAAGCAAFLRKPFDPVSFIGHVEAALEV